MTPELTSGQVARLRLQSLGLVPGTGTVLRTPAEVVRHHLAIQAQDWGASRWAIGSRLPGATDADVLAAYDRGEIVRSWPARGTVHAVAAEDLHWLLALLSERALAGVERRRAIVGVDEPMLERAREVAVVRLGGGASCTRAELLDAFTEAGLDVRGQKSYHTIWYLAQTGTLVLGATNGGGDQLLTLLDEWVTAPRPFDRDAALAELGRRYLAARGPAGVDDLAHWTKLGKRECAQAFAANGDDVVEVQAGERTLFMLRGAFEQLDPDSPAAARSTLALAGFDEHLLGYRVRDDVLDPTHAQRVVPGANGVFRWTIVDAGRVVGTWARKPRARRVDVEFDTFVPASAALRARAATATAAWGAFTGLPTALVD